jgi:enterochelin esterase family protein
LSGRGPLAAAPFARRRALARCLALAAALAPGPARAGRPRAHPAPPAVVTTGRQDDPGTVGDGTVPQPEPYAPAPESLSRLHGAPAGRVLGPLVYKATRSYEGWATGWQFRYWVYVPAQYKAGHRAALLVLQDGRHYVGDPNVSGARFNAPTVLDNLIAEGSMPVTIAVFIDPGSPNGEPGGGGDPNRSRQYDTPNDQYGRFVIEELLPAAILSKYDVVTDPDGWAIGGHSSGGIAALVAAWFHPERFHKVLSSSASFSNTGGIFPARLLTVRPPKPLRVYQLSGTRDLRDWFEQNNQAAKDLAAMGYHYRYRTGTDIHFPPAAAAADFPDALRWLWRGYHTPP